MSKNIKNFLEENFEEWQDVRKELLSPEEAAESDTRVALMCELIEARQNLGISQRKLEELSGVKQPIISRLEKGSTSPNIGTVIKLLLPLGKTLYIGDINSDKGHNEATEGHVAVV